MANAISKTVNKIIRRQKRKHALAKVGSALKTAGKAAAVLGAMAGTVLVVQAVARKNAETQKRDRRKKTTLAAAAAAATAEGARAIRARVKREKAPR
jgi:hypothetical protein